MNDFCEKDVIVVIDQFFRYTRTLINPQLILFQIESKMSIEVRGGRPTMPTIPQSKRPTILVYPTGENPLA